MLTIANRMLEEAGLEDVILFSDVSENKTPEFAEIKVPFHYPKVLSRVEGKIARVDDSLDIGTFTYEAANLVDDEGTYCDSLRIQLKNSVCVVLSKISTDTSDGKLRMARI